MKKILIKFHDNDFYRHFQWFLGNLGNALDEGDLTVESLTKERLCFMHNETIKASGVFTARWDLSHHYPESIEEHILKEAKSNEKYLRLTEDRIYFDEEADELIKEHEGWMNHESFVLEIWEEKEKVRDKLAFELVESIERLNKHFPDKEPLKTYVEYEIPRIRYKFYSV